MVAELIKQKKEINEKIVIRMKEDTEVLKKLADDMAEAATTLHGQGYMRFIDARTIFLNEMDRIYAEYATLVSSLQVV